MSEPILLPYDVPRNLDRDAWFLYETTSIPYYELCARLCEEFAHFFNKLVTGHQAHGMPAYQCVEGQRFRKGCHVFVFDEAFKEVGFHTIEIKEAAPYFCNAVLAVGVGDKARNELLVTVQFLYRTQAGGEDERDRRRLEAHDGSAALEGRRRQGADRAG